MTASRHAKPDTAPAGPTGGDRRNVVIIAGLAAALRIPIYFASRHLTFDDGVFASSALAMRDGGIPFRQVFSSQGPLFLPLVYVGDLLGLRTMDSPRLIGVVAGVALTVFIYLTLSRLEGPTTAIYGGLVMATSGCVIWVTGPLAADGPALAFAALAFWLTIIYTERPGPSIAVIIGLAAGAAMSVKSIHVPLLVVVAVATLTPLVNDLRGRRFELRSLTDPLAAGASAAAVFLITSIPFGIGNVWNQTFVYRTETSGRRDPIGNVRKMFSTLWDRDLVLLALAVLTIAWAVTKAWERRSTTTGRVSLPGDANDENHEGAGASLPFAPSGRLLSTVWLATAVVWLAVGVNPMWRSHVSGLVPPAVLVLALYAPPRRWLRYAAIVCVPLAVIQLFPIVVPGPYRNSEKAVVEVLRALPPGAWVLSDEPGLAWRAGHRTTDDLVDPSVLRIRSGRYDEDSLIEAASDERICAVVVRSDERFGSFEGLGARLDALGFVPTSDRRVEGRPGQEVYLRTDCSPAS